MSDLDRQGWFSDAIRGLFAKLDSFVYSLISGLYQIFYYVATATIIEGETVRNFYSRVQLILGVIIMFKVAISLFNGIMNPDSLNDNKNGFSSIIKRIVMVLIMLVLMVPLNIPNVGSEDSYDNNSQESWNARMNNNGILFGTLFEIQSRLLSQNTISKLILGDNDNDEEYSLDGSYSGYQLSSIILKSFVTPNVLVDGLDPEDDKNRVCSADALSSQYDDDSYADIYDQYESTMIPSNVLSMVNVSCSPEESIGQKIGTVLGTIAGGAGGAVIGGPIGLLIGAFGANTAADAIVDYQNGAYYAFSYSYIFSTLIGVLVVILLVSFTVDAAIRVFKLAILKLIAPVPILSYIDPKTESTFQNWLKMIGTTFADLFIRLGILNLIVFFIKELDSNGFGLHLDDATGIVPIFAKLFIILGLLMFAKEAPKFITDALGIKDGGKLKLFGGMSRLGGLGATAAAGISSFRSGMAASRDADRKNNNNDMSLGNRIKHVGSGLAAAVSGARMAGSAYSKAENNRWRSSLDQVNRANAMRRANGAAGGTWWGAEKAQLAQDFTGDSEYDRTKREIKMFKERGSELNKSKAAFDRKKSLLSAMQGVGKGVISSASDEVQKKGAYFDLTSKSYQAIDSDGNKFSISGMTGDLKGIKSALSVGESTGVYKYGGYEFDAATLNKMYADALDNAVDSYVSGNAKMGDGVTALNQSATFKAQLTNAMSDYKEAGYNLNIDSLRSDLKGVNDSIGAQIEAQNVQINRLEQQIYNNTLMQQDSEAKLESLSADMRGTDGSRGGK